MWRRAIGFILMGVFSTVVGAAASVAVSSNALGAATASTPRCTTAGFTVLQNLSGSTVVSMTIGNLPAACGNATVQATVNTGVANASGSAVVPAGGGSVTVTFGSAPAVTAAEQIDLVVVGP